MKERLLKITWFAALFTLGSVGVLYILPSFWLKLLFCVFLFGMVVWIAHTREDIDVNTLSLITAYVLGLAMFGLHFYYAAIPAWMFVIFSAVWVGSLFWLGLQLVTGRVSGSLKVISLVAGLAGAEVALGFLFWPTHFLVTATAYFLLFYLGWMVSYFYMSGHLNWHKMMVHTVFVVLVLSLVLFTAQWQI